MFPVHAGGGPMGLLRARQDVSGVRIRPAVVRRALRFAAPYRPRIAAFILTTTAGSALAVVPPLLFRRLIDVALPARDQAGIALLAAGAVGVALGGAALSLTTRWLAASVGEGLIFDLRVRLFDHVQRMPMAFFTRSQTGALVSRLDNDVVGAQQAVTGTLGSIVSNAISVGAILAAMLRMEWRITLLALSVLPLFILPTRRIGRRLRELTREQMRLNASMNALMTERFNVAGAMLAKLFSHPDQERARFADRASRVRDIGVRLAVYMRGFFIALGLVAAVGTAVVYYVGGRLVLSGAISVGTLVAFAAYVAQLYTPLTQLTNARVDLAAAFVSFERVFEVLDLPHGIADRPGAPEMPRPRGRIEFDHVWFRYPRAEEASLASLAEGLLAAEEGSAEYVLRDVSFTLEPGKTAALVGPSGAGKTSIALLVPRLYDVSEGAVRIDGIDVRDVRQDSLRRHVGVVPQDPHLFHDSIRANLLLARPDASERDLVEALRAAHIWDLVAGLPEGLDTVVGERGYRLSGGEKQRIAIARLLLKDPAIVILDEATSHLDSESELAVQMALREVLRGRTAIVIAHRLSTIVEADEILVVEDGRIVERGPHEVLLAEGGLYSELYHRQFARAAVGREG